MDIYKMNDKDLRKTFGEFSKTNYGKIVGILSFVVPFVFFVLSIITFVMMMIGNLQEVMVVLAPVFALLTLIFFINGNRYFYKELKAFIEYKRNK